MVSGECDRRFAPVCEAFIENFTARGDLGAGVCVYAAFGYGAEAFGPSPRTFGHWGYGGSVGFADLDRRLGFAYVMNQQRLPAPGNPDRRWPALVEAVYHALG